MTRKGVYPYEYMDSFERFNEISLPSKDKFYSSLTDNGIEDTEYAHAHNVWNTFQMKTMQDYHDLYLITDTLLLADVFEEFRKMCLENYKLDPVHSYTAPGLSWQAALKMTNVELDLLTDKDQHLFIEEGIKGGVSMISHRQVTFICITYSFIFLENCIYYISFCTIHLFRYARANYPGIQEYDISKENEHLIYLDANNLYSWAMGQSLPTKSFRWLTEEEKFDTNFMEIGGRQ